MKRFILWDPTDGEPRRDEAGEIESDGIIGRVTEGNVYLQAYGKFPEGPRVGDLAPGEAIHGVRYNLSPGPRAKGKLYDVYRVADLPRAIPDGA